MKHNTLHTAYIQSKREREHSVTGSEGLSKAVELYLHDGITLYIRTYNYIQCLFNCAVFSVSCSVYILCVKYCVSFCLMMRKSTIYSFTFIHILNCKIYIFLNCRLAVVFVPLPYNINLIL